MTSPTGPPKSVGIISYCWLEPMLWEAALLALIISCEKSAVCLAWSEIMATNKIEDPELYHSMKKANRFRHVCKQCMKHKRTCPVCAGVL